MPKEDFSTSTLKTTTQQQPQHLSRSFQFQQQNPLTKDSKLSKSLNSTQQNQSSSPLPNSFQFQQEKQMKKRSTFTIPKLNQFKPQKPELEESSATKNVIAAKQHQAQQQQEIRPIVKPNQFATASKQSYELQQQQIHLHQHQHQTTTAAASNTNQVSTLKVPCQQ